MRTRRSETPGLTAVTEDELAGIEGGELGIMGWAVAWIARALMGWAVAWIARALSGL
jgi:hypothetical protein